MNQKFALKAFPALKTRKVCDFDHTVLEFVGLLNTFVLGKDYNFTWTTL